MLGSEYTAARDALKNKISEVRQLFSTTNSDLKNTRKQTHQGHYKLKQCKFHRIPNSCFFLNM